MRKNILKMSLAAGSGSSHFGGSLSTVELLVTLYNSVLKFDVSNPLWEDRDRFILSKGHACLGYYSVLCEKGYFTKGDLDLFEKNGSFLLGHPVIRSFFGYTHIMNMTLVDASIGYLYELRFSPHGFYVL